MRGDKGETFSSSGITTKSQCTYRNVSTHLGDSRHQHAEARFDWASTLARQLFSHYDEETGRGTKVLLLSATPYRMYARTGESDDHFADFLNTCSFLFDDQSDVDELKRDFNLLRLAMTNASVGNDASDICSRIQKRLSLVMARTERLGVTPDRNGMLEEHVHLLPISVEDLKS